MIDFSFRRGCFALDIFLNQLTTIFIKQNLLKVLKGLLSEIQRKMHYFIMDTKTGEI